VECLVGRITQYPPKPKPKYLHDVTVLHTEVDQAWIWEEAVRIGGIMGYSRRSRGWTATAVAFDTQEKADKLMRKLRRWRHEQDLAEMRRHPCPVAIRYAEASLRQHGVVWALATGHLRPIVQAYRRARMNCSTHESPNWDATKTMVSLAPTIDFERGRKMVDAILIYIEARHREWFWRGLQGDRRIASSFLHY
jgi:hypothetical protein